MSNISLAKILRTRKTIKGEIADLTRRAEGCVSWQDGVSRDFDFASVDAQRKAKIQALVRLESALARANVTATLTWDDRQITIAEAIRTLAELKSELTFVAGLTLTRGTQKVPTGEYDANHRPVFATVQWTAAYTEPERVALLAQLRGQCADLNEALEEANHRTLVEVSLS